jgi:hypothetical protein
MNSLVEVYYLDNKLYMYKLDLNLSSNYNVENKLNNADPFGIVFRCEKCDYENIKNYKELNEWKVSMEKLAKSWTNDEFNNYKKGKKAYAKTNCHDYTPNTVWYNSMKSLAPCVNCVIRDHENVHCRQCRESGESLFSDNIGKNLWENVEKEAYEETWKKIGEYLNNIIKYRKEKGLPL